MASNRQESAAIDTRNAAVMELQAEHRRLRHTLARIMEGWNAIDLDERVPESLNDGRMEEARLVLKQIKAR